MIPAMNGEIAPAEAAKKIRDDLQSLANMIETHFAPSGGDRSWPAPAVRT